jgi:acyltransferase
VALDVARLAGLVSISLTHTFGSSPWTKWLYSWVIMYLFLSGYLWSAHRTFGDEVRRRTASLLVPYISWMAVLIVAVQVRALATHSRPNLHAAAAALYGGSVAVRPFTTFYFFTVLFFSTLLVRVLMRLPLAVQILVPLSGLTVAAFLGPELARTPLSIGSAWPCCAFVFAGILFKRYKAWLRPPLAVGLGALAVAVVGFTFHLQGTTRFKGGRYGTPFVAAALAVAVCVALVLIIESLSHRVPDRLQGWLSVAAKNSLVVVLLHPTVLWVFNARTDTASIGVYALVLLVPTLLTVALTRIPAASPLLGQASWDELVARFRRSNALRVRGPASDPTSAAA